MAFTRPPPQIPTMLSALLLAPLLLMQGPSEKELFDSYLNNIKTAQLSDGSYGGNVVVTADVLIGMALSPEATAVPAAIAACLCVAGAPGST